MQEASKEGILSMGGLHQSRRCILHFLDINKTNIAEVYLKAAWHAKWTGNGHFYLVKLQNGMQLSMLNLTYTFDFKRLAFVLPLSVSSTGWWYSINCSLIFQSGILRIVAPDEFAKQSGYFKYRAIYTKSTGVDNTIGYIWMYLFLI